MLFWMTPIVSLEAVLKNIRCVGLNPITYLMQGWRAILLNNKTNWHDILFL